MPAVIFIALNVMDAYSTKIALAVGAGELNALVGVAGSDVPAKGFLATAAVFFLYWFSKEKVLPLLNLMLFGVVLWNLAVYTILNLEAGIPPIGA